MSLKLQINKGDETILQEHIIDLYYRLVMLPKIEMLELIIDEHVQTQPSTTTDEKFASSEFSPSLKTLSIQIKTSDSFNANGIAKQFSLNKNELKELKIYIDNLENAEAFWKYFSQYLQEQQTLEIINLDLSLEIS